MPIFRNILTFSLLSGATAAAVAQSPSFSYEPTNPIFSVPIPSLFLIPLALLVLGTAMRYIAKLGPRHPLSITIFSCCLAAMLSVGPQVREVIAQGSILELLNPKGDTVIAPEGLQEYQNTSGVPLSVTEVNAGSCVSSAPANECVMGTQLAINASCNTAFVCTMRSIAISGTEDAQGVTPGSFTLTASEAAPNGGLTIYYSIQGTAEADTDYTALTGSIEIPAGATSVDIPVNPIDINYFGPDRTVEITLSADPTYALDASITAEVNLVAAPGDGLFRIDAFRLSGGGGATDTQLNNTTETLNIWNAIDGGAVAPGAVAASGKTYNVSALETDTSSLVDYGGGGGNFGSTQNFNTIGGGSVPSTNDFSVRARTRIHFTVAGTYSIAVGSDDGRWVSLTETFPGSAPGYTGFTAVNNQVDGSFTPGDTSFIREAPTGHNVGVGVFTVAAGDVLLLDTSFYERGGGDSFEVSIAAGSVTPFNAGTYTLLADDTLGGAIKIHSAGL